MNNANILRMKQGIKNIWERKVFLFLPIAYILLIGNGIYSGLQQFERMGHPYSSDLFTIIFCILAIEIIIIGVFAILCLLGTPTGSRKRENELKDIGFTDRDGNAPILISKANEGKGIRYEFYSPKISFVKYEDHIAELETALNVKIIDIVPGKDTRHVVIRAIKTRNKENGVIFWKDEYLSKKDFEIVLGEGYFGTEIIDLSLTPHLLLGGATGSGKSRLLKLTVMQAIKKDAEVYLVDMKGGVDYSEIWKKTCQIVTDVNGLNAILDNVLQKMEERKTMLVSNSVPNILEYSLKTGEKIPRIIVAFDEIAEVLDKTGLDKEEKQLVNQIEAKLSTIARLGRAFGAHCIFSTQRPDADILKGQIKNNIGYRVCGRADKILSQIILDKSDASEKISPKDQGMFLMNTGVLFKAYYVEDDCLEGSIDDRETAD